MTTRFTSGALLALVPAATLFASLGFSLQASANNLVKVDGSSTVFPVTEAVAEEFQKAKKGAIKVTVGISGTGGGFKKFCRGETDVQNASRPILAEEMDTCAKAGVEYVELPVAFDALTVIVSPKNTWLKSITVAELKKIWEPAAQGKVMKWKDVNPAWPDEPLKLYGPGSDSGTFDYFTEAITGKSKASRGDFTASEDDNVLVQGVSNDKNALGYFGFAYYDPNRSKLRALPIDGGEKAPKKGVAIAPSKESVMDGTYYPLARPIFIYISKKALEKPEVKEFSDFYVNNAGRLAADVKYVALPASAYSAGLDRVAKKQVGTAFGGHNEVGLNADQLMKRTLSLKYAEKK
ncbi:MAG: PstS family phosphate ABC transporter substrate-binding protein [Silvanigrellales bacterium]|nr:PstS family phosphate ABC transporter substrate-binding protein [Silvanigrellales bacterium]